MHKLNSHRERKRLSSMEELGKFSQLIMLLWKIKGSSVSLPQEPKLEPSLIWGMSLR
jgi:hypothetical protein